MKLSYSVKLDGNGGKLEKLDLLLTEWQRLVNEKIELLWAVSGRSKYPPQAARLGSRLHNQAAQKAWGMCKSARRLNGSKPVYRGSAIEYDACQYTLDLNAETTSFDGWLHLATLEKRARISLPFNKYRLFLDAEARGRLCGGIRLVKRGRKWFATFMFETPEIDPRSTRRIGIDVGYSIAAATSTGEFYGEDLDALQRRTKWRTYRSHDKKPYRQGLNRVAKEIVRDNPRTDFQLESLYFQRGCGQSRIQRTRLSRFAYAHLAKRLDLLGKLEGFQVSQVNPAYSSQRCPRCGVIDSRNRRGRDFCCTACGLTGHADTIAGINLNGGEAEVNYAGSAPASPCRVPEARVPGGLPCPDGET